MIKALTVTNYLGEEVRMELMSPEKSGFVIESITGLGPGTSDINVTELATNDGALYNSARLGSRNIVITLSFLFDKTIEDVRQKSYQYFPIKKQVRLLFETDNRVCEIHGYVETNDPVIFSQKQTTQISIICPNPYFYSVGKNGTNTTVFNGVEPLFEFPFSNESVDVPLLECSMIQNVTEQTVYYTGDAETGIVIVIDAIGEASNITIYNVTTREVMKIDTDRLSEITGSGIIKGDQIVISTIKGDKTITLLRNGYYTNILNCLSKDAKWFQLTKGDNLFAYTAETGISNLNFRIENRIVYEGV